MISFFTSILILSLSLNFPQEIMENSNFSGNEQEVELTFISIQPDSKSDVIRLNWTTENEQKVIHYFIDHSTDGVQYSRLDEVSAFNDVTAVNLYQYKHENPTPGINFYRLSCKYKDGTIVELDTENIIYSLEETVTD